MMKHTIELNSIGDIDKAAEAFFTYCEDEKFFYFYGEMGVGKTTFIRALCKKLGSEDRITSPSFAIVNEYAGKEKIYHIDAFRVDDPEDLIELGLEEYFSNGAYCFVEWAERIADYLHNDAVKVVMELKEDNKRIITIDR